MAFGRFKPIECRYMVPGDAFNYDITADIRALSNLPSPTYGQFKMKFRAFFVPLHKLYNNFYEYLSNQFSAVNGNMGDTNLPYTDLQQFFLLFTTTNTTYGAPLVELLDDTPESDSEWDILADGEYYYRLTKRGRRVYDFLTSLGLNLPFKDWDSSKNQIHLNIFPLIAFWKFYYDWIVPSRYDNDHDSNIKIFLSIINNWGASDTPLITAKMISDYLIHDMPVSYFEDDVYTTSTYMPFSDQANMQDGFYMSNPSSNQMNAYAEGSLDLQNEMSGANVDENNGTAFNTFSLQTLGKLQDYLTRALIAGNKIKDWLMSEFGLRPSDDSLGLSTYLGMKDFTLDIKGVLSTSDTEAQGGVALGSYGGYVNNSTNVNFSFESKEHGYLFITFELIPRTSYVNALNPEWTMLDRFDFFQPEFDNQQGAVIPYEQVDFENNLYLDRVFGFNLQYATLKQANDVMSGDFKNRFGLELKSWFLSRNLPSIVAGNTRINEEFCKVNSWYQDWNYIFADTGDDVDHWLTYFNIRNHAMRPMKSIVEGFEPEYMNSKKNVTLSFNGAAN